MKKIKQFKLDRQDRARNLCMKGQKWKKSEWASESLRPCETDEIQTKLV
jgi:hypothetical protein